MYVDIQTIITFSTFLAAVISIGGIIVAIVKWFDKQKQQDIDIAAMKEEQCLLTFGILACLKGLKEQGCNGPVTETIDKIERHINKKAHGQE